MTQIDVDKLIDDLIDAKDRYAELAAALGYRICAVDGVPIAEHEQVLGRARELASFARVA